MKKCIKCNLEKENTQFHKKETAKDKLFSWCIDCHRIITKTRYSERRKGNKAFIDSESARVKAWRLANPEKYKESSTRYINNNRGTIVAKVTAYRINKNKRTPKWVDSEESWLIKEVYRLAADRTKNTGIEWHVDHIIPLHGKKVSGLHTISNLQVIPGKSNKCKSNKYELI